MNKDKIINRCNRIAILLKEEAPNIIINNEVELLTREVEQYQTINGKQTKKTIIWNNYLFTTN